MPLQAAATVVVSVEITVRGENWNEHTAIEQLHREASELAIKRIIDLCQRYVRLIGNPKVTAILVEKER